VEKSTNFANFLAKTVTLPAIFGRFTDVRDDPEIKLQDIFMSIFLMPFFKIRSLLSLDRICRERQFKLLFACERKMVASDSTIARTLDWIMPEETDYMLLSLLPYFEREHLLQKQLIAGGNTRKIGIVDGSCMSNHFLSALVLHGKVDFPVLIRLIDKRGKELPVSNAMLKEAKEMLGKSFPELLTFDALYFNQHTFKIVRELGSHILVKSRDASFRDILKDAECLFGAKGDMQDDVTKASGYDAQRLCEWSAEMIVSEFAGYPMQILRVKEHYTKTGKEETFWVVTTDMSLSLEEVREAAHLRWHIENNVFKRLSKHTGSKTFYFKESTRFLNLLKVFCAAIAVLDAYIYSIRQDEKYFNRLRDGIKPTWANIFSRIAETLLPGAFAFS